MPEEAADAFGRPRQLAHVADHRAPELRLVARGGLDADLKQVVTREAPARDKPRLRRAVVGHMRKLSRSPERVRSLFGHHTFRYAA